MAAGELLQLTPASELKFRFEIRKNVTATLSLHNPGSDRVAFKLKTTAPKKFAVRPSSGIVEPGTTKEVHVIMQAQREYPPGGLAECRDKFLVQSVRLSAADASATEATPEMFDASRAKDIRQTKLRVVLVGPPKPPSPVPEGNEDDGVGFGAAAGAAGAAAGAAAAAGGAAAAAQGLDALARERDHLREALARSEREKAAAQARLDAVSGGGGAGLTKRVGAGAGGRGFSILSVVLVALLAFVAGHFLAKKLPFLA